MLIAWTNKSVLSGVPFLTSAFDPKLGALRQNTESVISSLILTLSDTVTNANLKK